MKRKAIKTKQPPRWQFSITWDLRTSLAAAAIVLALVRFVVLPLLIPGQKSPAPQSRGRIAEAMAAVQKTLDRFNIGKEWQKPTAEGYQVNVPMEFPFVKFYLALREELQHNHMTILSSTEYDNSSKYILTVGQGNDTTRVIINLSSGLPNRKALVGIIIDDFGYNFGDLEREIIRFPEPLTISIIPHLNFAGEAAREANMVGKEILIHMPMEPLQATFDVDDMVLLTEQTSGEWRIRIKKAMGKLPTAIGMNNHQGSKATMDRDMMNTVMDELKKAQLIFVDSNTSPRSVAFETAQRLRVPAAENNLFLDARDDEEFIAAQFDRLAEIAREHGQAIGIGHVRKKTLQVLQEKLPDLKARGCEIVTISKLCK